MVTAYGYCLMVNISPKLLFESGQPKSHWVINHRVSILSRLSVFYCIQKSRFGAEKVNKKSRFGAKVLRTSIIFATFAAELNE